MKILIAALAPLPLLAQSAAPVSTSLKADGPGFRIEAAPGSRPVPPEPTPTAVRPQTATGMNNDSIIRLVKSGMGEGAIVSLITSQPGAYALDVDSLLGLKQAGVPDGVISAMATSRSSRSLSAAPPEPKAFAPAATNANPFVLHEATPVRLRLKRNLSSATARTDETIDFEVLDQVLVDNVVVLDRGSVAIGAVTRAQAKRRMARGGKLDVTIDHVRLIDGEKIPLRGVREGSGGGHTGAMTGAIVATSLVVWPAAPFFLFMHGKDYTIPQGTEITAYVNGEVPLNRAKFIR